MKYLTNLDLSQNQLLNVRAQQLASDPGSPTAGQFWFNTTDNRLKYYDGSSVVTLTQSSEGTLSGILGSAPITATDNGDGTYTIAIDAATTTTPGSLSASDKQKLDNTPADTITALSGKSDTGHQHTLTDVTDSGTAASYNVPAAGDAAVGEVVKGDDTRLSDARTPTSHNHPISEVTNLQTTLDGKIDNTEKGAANGVAELDASGLVPVAQLPDTVTGALDYQGTWDASTNSPTLTSSTGQKGDYYRVSVAGSTTLDGESDWGVGDWVLFNGTIWEKLDQTESVTSVATKTGDVTLVASDIGGVGTNLANIGDAATARSNLGATGKYSVDVGDGASTTITVTHNLNTLDVVTSIRAAGAPYEVVMADVEIKTVNTLDVTFATAPTASQYRVTVIG